MVKCFVDICGIWLTRVIYIYIVCIYVCNSVTTNSRRSAVLPGQLLAGAMNVNFRKWITSYEIFREGVAAKAAAVAKSQDLWPFAVRVKHIYVQMSLCAYVLSDDKHSANRRIKDYNELKRWKVAILLPPLTPSLSVNKSATSTSPLQPCVCVCVSVYIVHRTKCQ